MTDACIALEVDMDLLRHAPAIVLRSGVRLVAAVLCGLSTLAAAQGDDRRPLDAVPVSYTHLRAHET